MPHFSLLNEITFHWKRKLQHWLCMTLPTLHDPSTYSRPLARRDPPCRPCPAPGPACCKCPVCLESPPARGQTGRRGSLPEPSAVATPWRSPSPATGHLYTDQTKYYYHLLYWSHGYITYILHKISSNSWQIIWIRINAGLKYTNFSKILK